MWSEMSARDVTSLLTGASLNTRFIHAATFLPIKTGVLKLRY